MEVVAFRNEGNGMFRCLHPKKVADLEIGAVHGWQLAEHRSPESHRHFFACVADAWANLPETIADDFPSFEHLRKWALCKAGYCDVTKLVLPTNAEAIAAAALMTGMDSYAIIDISGRVLTVARAHSQSVKAMGKAKFQESKERTLHVISELIGTDAANLGKAA